MVVEVHQTVRDLEGQPLLDETVRHVFRLESGRVKRFDIQGDSQLSTSPSFDVTRCSLEALPNSFAPDRDGLSVGGPATRGPRLLRLELLHDLVKGLELLLGRDGVPLLELLDGGGEELRELLRLRGGPLRARVLVGLGLLPFLGQLGTEVERPAVVAFGPHVKRPVGTAREAPSRARVAFAVLTGGKPSSLPMRLHSSLNAGPWP